MDKIQYWITLKINYSNQETDGNFFKLVSFFQNLNWQNMHNRPTLIVSLASEQDKDTHDNNFYSTLYWST